MLTGAPLGRSTRTTRRSVPRGGRLVSVFARFAPRLQEAIVARLGWTSLRPVQEQAGEALLDGENAVVLAPTAGGKTEASMFPALSQLVERRARRRRRALRRADQGAAQQPGRSARALHRDGRPAALRLARRHRRTTTAPQFLPRAGRAADDDAGVARGDARLAAGRRGEALRRSAHRRHRRGPRARRHRPRRAPDERPRAARARLAARRPARRAVSATVGQPRRDPRVAPGHVAAAGRGRRPAEAAGAAAAPRRPPPGPRGARRRGRGAWRAGQKSLFFCQSRATTEAVAEHMRRAGTDGLRPPQRRLARGARSSPRSASTTAPTPASSAPPRSSSASTSATSIACSRPRRPTR